MISRLFILLALVLSLHLSNLDVVAAVAEEDDPEAMIAELFAEMGRSDDTKSDNRKNVINLIQAVVDEHTSKAENHESGANVLERSEYWKAKTAVTQYKTMLNMFESNMADEFLIRMLDEQKQRAEEKYENEPKPEHLLEIENWAALLKVLTSKRRALKKRNSY